jgi:hypothetical protein
MERIPLSQATAETLRAPLGTASSQNFTMVSFQIRRLCCHSSITPW